MIESFTALVYAVLVVLALPVALGLLVIGVLGAVFAYHLWLFFKGN